MNYGSALCENTGESITEEVFVHEVAGPGGWTRNPKVQSSNPRQWKKKESQLVCLLPAGIFNY